MSNSGGTPPNPAAHDVVGQLIRNAFELQSSLNQRSLESLESYDRIFQQLSQAGVKKDPAPSLSPDLIFIVQASLADSAFWNRVVEEAKTILRDKGMLPDDPCDLPIACAEARMPDGQDHRLIDTR